MRSGSSRASSVTRSRWIFFSRSAAPWGCGSRKNACSGERRRARGVSRATSAAGAMSPGAEQAPEGLPAPVVKALKRHALPAQSVSVTVHEVGSAEPLVAHLADTPRNPASVMKLLTTLAALEELGPAYSWKTEAFATAPVRAGRLEGD